MKIAAIIGIILLATLLLVPTASFVYESGAPGACARCHEMAVPVDQWAGSSHRGVACSKCHGDALTTDAQFHMTNARRVVEHNFGEVAEQARLRPADVYAIIQQINRLGLVAILQHHLGCPSLGETRFLQHHGCGADSIRLGDWGASGQCG